MAEDGVLVGGGGRDYAEPRELLLRYGNRHGLITGATGTGKTVTVQILAEGLSAAGVPVVVQDVKGDVSGLSRPGDPGAKAHESLTKRAAQIGMASHIPFFTALAALGPRTGPWPAFALGLAGSLGIAVALALLRRRHLRKTV